MERMLADNYNYRLFSSRRDIISSRMVSNCRTKWNHSREHARRFLEIIVDTRNEINLCLGYRCIEHERSYIRYLFNRSRDHARHCDRRSTRKQQKKNRNPYAEVDAPSGESELWTTRDILPWRFENPIDGYRRFMQIIPSKALQSSWRVRIWPNTALIVGW